MTHHLIHSLSFFSFLFSALSLFWIQCTKGHFELTYSVSFNTRLLFFIWSISACMREVNQASDLLLCFYILLQHSQACIWECVSAGQITVCQINAVSRVFPLGRQWSLVHQCNWKQNLLYFSCPMLFSLLAHVVCLSPSLSLFHSTQFLF